MGLTSNKNDSRKLEDLNNTVSTPTSSGKVTYSSWTQNFGEGAGKKSGLEVEAMLSY